jgi:Flp pilus assembly protein TadD
LAACASTGQSAQTSADQPRAENASLNDRLQEDRADRQARNQDAAAPRRAPRVDRQARAHVDREDILTQMTFWASEYDTFPNDLEAAQRFSEALRKGGRYDRAAQVADEASRRFPNDRALVLTLGLAQLAAGHPQDALRPLAMVCEADAQNWKARSALGAALDQLGRFEEARRAYDEALAISPNQPDVLTNKGVSFLLSRQPEQAEPLLRQASTLQGAPPQARQNLAIALALQGRFDEAEQLERADLPPRVVAENMSYLRGLLSDPRRWHDVGRN